MSTIVPSKIYLSQDCILLGSVIFFLGRKAFHLYTTWLRWDFRIQKYDSALIHGILWTCSPFFGDITNYNLIMEDLIINSRNIGLSRVYPFYDYSNKKLPTKYADWQYRCCVELYNLADKTGFHTYSENGLSWGKATDGISLQLLNEITSKAGVPSKVIDEEDSDE